MNRAQRLRVLLTHAYTFLSWGFLGPSSPRGGGDGSDVTDLATSAAGTFASIATLRVEQTKLYVSLANTTSSSANFTLTPRTTGGTASAITFPVLANQVVSLPTESFSDIAPPSLSASYLWIYSSVPITGPRTVGGTNGLSGATFVCLINFASSAATSFWQIGQGNTATNAGTGLTVAQSDIVVGRAGVLKNLYVNVITNAYTTGPSWTLEKNDADTALVASIAATTTGVVSDTTHTVSVVAGDKICIKLLTGGDVASHAGLFYVTLEFD